MSKFFTINLVVFPFSIDFTVGQTIEEFLASVSHYPDREDWASRLFAKGNYEAKTSHDEETGSTMVNIKAVQTVYQNHGVIAHEIFHAVELILRHMGISLNEGTDEVYAYLIQYVTQEFYSKIKEI